LIFVLKTKECSQQFSGFSDKNNHIDTAMFANLISFDYLSIFFNGDELKILFELVAVAKVKK
jgi:hypothetical protein